MIQQYGFGEVRAPERVRLLLQDAIRCAARAIFREGVGILDNMSQAKALTSDTCSWREEESGRASEYLNLAFRLLDQCDSVERQMRADKNERETTRPGDPLAT